MPEVGLTPDNLTPDSLTPDIGSLVGEHYSRIFAYAYRLSGTTADAEDLTQQTFLIAQQKLDQLRETRHAQAWLASILRNCYLRSKRRRRPVAAAVLEFDLNLVAEDIPDEIDIDRELVQLVLNDMPEKFKLPLLMYYLEDASYREIAAGLNLPIGTVMSRLSRAKEFLRGRVLSSQPEAVGAAGSP